MTSTPVRSCVHCHRETGFLQRRDHDGFTWECIDKRSCDQAALDRVNKEIADRKTRVALVREILRADGVVSWELTAQRVIDALYSTPKK